MMMAMASDYGQRIRRRRQELGLSQKQLGERVGVSESAVISWEKYRHAPTRKQGAIEAALGISLDGDPVPPPDPDEELFYALTARLEKRGVNVAPLIEEFKAAKRRAAADPVYRAS